MTKERDALIPVLRSRTQGRILAEVLLRPATTRTISDLARACGADIAGVQREVSRLVEERILTAERIGRARLVSAGDSRLVDPLVQLLLVSYGPKVIVAEELEGLEKVERVGIFGSWAARYAGEPGPPPNDIDILIVGRPDRDAAYAGAQRIEDRLRIPTQLMIVAQDPTSSDSSRSFPRQLREVPLVWVTP